MGTWLVIVVPAFIAALLIRYDAKYAGPYFPLSALIAGYEGLLAFVDDKERRAALFRRFGYPFVMGYILDDFQTSIIDAAAAGLLTAILLLWPMVFHGIDPSIKSRGKSLFALYASFVIAMTSLSSIGHILSTTTKSLVSNNFMNLFLSNLPITIALALIFSLSIATFRFFAKRVRKRIEQAWRNELHEQSELELDEYDTTDSNGFGDEERGA